MIAARRDCAITVCRAIACATDEVTPVGRGRRLTRVVVRVIEKR
jgi:hypothetical protein